MNADKIIDQLTKLGGRLHQVEGKWRLCGKGLPEELKERARLQRDEVLAAWEKRLENYGHRYGLVPPDVVPQKARFLELPKQNQEAIESYVLRQGRPATDWVMRRSLAYYEDDVVLEQTDWKACVDLIAWQRAATAQSAVDFVNGLDVCYETLGDCKPKTQKPKE